MTPDIDVRDHPQTERRSRIFERLDSVDTAESVSLLADDEIDVHLDQYQIKRGHRLDWDTEQTETGALEIHVTKGDPLGDDEWTDFDVREMPPQRRHEVLLETFDDLEPDEGFVLVNDHDPRPLYHELRSTRGETFEWEYLSEGDDEWRVQIVKTDETEPVDDDIITRFDVREIPKQERHPSIHHRYGMIPEGETMEIVAPHEPQPLHREFREKYGDTFTWDVVEKEAGKCRVRITKQTDETAEDEDETATSVGHSLEVTEEMDVRDLPPAKRHEKIFEAYDGLQQGEAFVLVNDHDPEPLYHQFDAEAGDEFTWEYQQQEPGEFKVLIGKSEIEGEGAESSDDVDAPF